MTIFHLKLLVAAFYSAKMYSASSRCEAVRFGVLVTSLLIEDPLLKTLLYTYLMFLIYPILDWDKLTDISQFCTIDLLPMPNFFKTFLCEFLKDIFDFRR